MITGLGFGLEDTGLGLGLEHAVLEFIPDLPQTTCQMRCDLSTLQSSLSSTTSQPGLNWKDVYVRYRRTLASREMAEAERQILLQQTHTTLVYACALKTFRTAVLPKVLAMLARYTKESIRLQIRCCPRPP